jgi:hypothetical protein
MARKKQCNWCNRAGADVGRSSPNRSTSPCQRQTLSKIRAHHSRALNLGAFDGGFTGQTPAVARLTASAKRIWLALGSPRRAPISDPDLLPSFHKLSFLVIQWRWCALPTGWQVSSCSESRLSSDGRASLEQPLRLAQSPFLSRAAPRHRKPTDLRPRSEIRWVFRRAPPPREAPRAGRLSVVFTQAAEPYASGCRGKIRWPWTPPLRILLSMRGRSPEETGTA